MFLLFLLLLLLLFLLLFSFCLVNGCVMLCRASVVGAVVVVCWICHIVYTLFSLSLAFLCSLFPHLCFFLHFCFALFWLAARVFGATWRMRNANALRIRNPFLHKAKYLSADIFMYMGNSWQEFWSQYAMGLLLQLPFQESCPIYMYISYTNRSHLTLTVVGLMLVGGLSRVR